MTSDRIGVLVEQAQAHMGLGPYRYNFIYLKLLQLVNLK